MRHGSLIVYQFPCLRDNYGFLLRDEETGMVAAVDTPDGEEVARQIDAKGWGLDLILNTHWHADHTGGNEMLKARYGARILGPDAEGQRIPGRDQALHGGDEVTIGKQRARVIETPGHTAGHIAFVFDEAGAAFVGDTLFSLGCGRLFEGEPAQMWQSLKALRDLPPDTTIYCAHEYTAANARFAVSIDPDNAALQARKAEVDRLRAEDRPTVPVRLADELRTNPFLRADDPALAARLGLEDAAPWEVFGEIRRRKDDFG